MASLAAYGGVLMVIVIAAMMGAAYVEVDDRASQARDYCTSQHNTSDIIWAVEDNNTHRLHCQLANDTLVDVPDRAFA